MINLPIWAFVLLCVFAFVGLMVAILLIYGLISAMLTPDYVYYESENEEYGTKDTNEKSN